MIQLLKHCLKKMVGHSKLTYEELLTKVTEVTPTIKQDPGSFLDSKEKGVLVELREGHKRISRGDGDIVSLGDVVIIQDESPQGFWRLGLIEDIIRGEDGLERGAIVQVKSGSEPSAFILRPLQRLFPLEVPTTIPESNSNSPMAVEQGNTSSDFNPDEFVDHNVISDPPAEGNCSVEIPDDTNIGVTSQPRRRAATEAWGRIVARLLDS
uniref:DUF5641 domain-containing protein n=1 Tax=Amphimedon queenslandica TaxID=400682 RepID=A0A1X7UB93_AMPQE